MTTDKLTSDLQTYETHSFNAVPEPVAIHREYDHSKDLIKTFLLISPDTRLKSEIAINERISFTLSDEQQTILAPSFMAIRLQMEKRGEQLPNCNMPAGIVSMKRFILLLQT